MQGHSGMTGKMAQVAAVLFAAILAPAFASAQQVTGVLGSPSATTTIEGR
jgi:hypothetical protein